MAKRAITKKSAKAASTSKAPVETSYKPKKKAGKKEVIDLSDDAQEISKKPIVIESEDEEPVKKRKRVRSISSSESPARPVKAVKEDPKPPFTIERADKLFTQYASADGKINDESGALLEAAGIAEESIDPLLLCFEAGCESFGAVTSSEWRLFCERHQADSITRLSTALKSLHKSLGDDMYGDLIQRLYRWLFIFLKSRDNRTLGLDYAVFAWTLLFEGRSEVGMDFLEFVKCDKTIKGINSDVWQSTLDYVTSVSLSEDKQLDGIEEDDSCARRIPPYVGPDREARTGPLIFDNYADWVANGRVLPAA